MAIQPTTYSIDDLWEISHQSADRYELVRGELIKMSPTGGVHGYVTMEIGAILRNHVRQHQLGLVTAAETGYILVDEPRTVRAPDVGLIQKARVPNPIPEKYFPLAPDLAVEVVSPRDTAKDIRNRVKDFLNAGTPIVWVVYPSSKSVDIHTMTAEGQLTRTLEETDTLTGEILIPNFEVRVADLFPSD